MMTDPSQRSDQAPDRGAGAPPLDLERLLQQCMRRPELVLRVLERFAAQLIADRQAICAAVSAADVSAVARTAHRLKGAAGAVAADRLHAVAALLETHAEQARLQAVRQELDGLIAEIERCAAYLPAARLAASALAGSQQAGGYQEVNQRCGF